MRFHAAETHCRGCQQLYPGSDLDRYLWCPGCRRELRRRGARWGRLVGLVVSAAVAGYLLIRVHPSRRYLPFYLLMLGLTYLLTSRIAVAIVQGYRRARAVRPGAAETLRSE